MMSIGVSSLKFVWPNFLQIAAAGKESFGARHRERALRHLSRRIRL
jgi:hypothetical protein